MLHDKKISETLAAPLKNEQEKAIPALELGIYTHVPFCARACDFCNFYQERPEGNDFGRYLDGIARELELRPIERAVSTVFWGRGTPGLLPARDLKRLGRLLLDAFPGPPREWSVELAPASVRADKLEALRELGVNRVSMGVQSFDDAMLDRLGRPHTRRQVDAALDLIEAAGFENRNVDLMFALPGQSLDDWKAALDTAIERGPAHISTYCLTFEEDTALWVRLQRGEVEKRNPIDEAAFYEVAWDTLEAAGFAQYEVSNFARSDYACRHNLATWSMQEWMGFGPSAASQIGQERSTNVHDLEAWLDGLKRGHLQYAEKVVLDDVILAGDALVFGLRMNAGVDLGELRRRFPEANWASLEGLFANLEEEELAARPGSLLRLTRLGRLLADRIGTAILEALD